MKKALFAAAAVAAFAGAASAQAQEAAWSGPYVGAHFGYSWRDEGDDDSAVAFDTNLDGTFSDTVRTAAGADAFSPGFCTGAGASAVPGGGCKDDDDGFEFGGRLGYDWQFGSFVVGAVGEVSRTTVKDSVTAFSTTPANYVFGRKLKHTAAARLRAGFAAGDNLIYATGGAVWGDIDHTFGSTNGVNTFTARDSDDWAKGYQLGGGFERKLTDDVTLGVEYLYNKLDDDDYVVRASGPAPATNPFILVNSGGTDLRPTEDKMKFHTVRITASYRF